MPAFNSFITSTKVYDKYKFSSEAMSVFNFLNLGGSVAKMIVATGEGKPALDGVVDELEAVFKGNKVFAFSKDEVRQCVGRMAQDIMNYYGYHAEKDMPLQGKKFFKNAMKYKK